MEDAGRWGITLPLDEVPLSEHRAVVERVEALGYSDVWSSEAAGADAFTPLALAAAWSSALRLGSAIAPVFTRGPGLLAMSAAALADAAPGRFVLGVGASTPIIVERWNATPFADPYRRTRDTVRFLRRALAGERVDERFDTFTVRGFRLARVPREQPAILVAALRPGMLRLGVREADGVITNCLAAADVPKVVAELGPPGAGKEVVARIFVCPTEDAGHARLVGRRLLSTYLTVPVYAEFHRWLGRGEVLEPMWRAWQAGDRGAANAAIPDEVVDELVIHGPLDACRERVRRYADAGVTTPVIALLPAGDGADAMRVLEGLAPPARA
jgi:probable F420-dependent oxidoreductase